MGKQKKHGTTQNHFQDSASERGQMPSRVAKRQTSGKGEKKNRNYLLPSLFFIFILIPVTILFYVAFVYEPNDMLQTAANENEVSVETNNDTSDSVAIVDEDDEEESDPAADDDAEQAAAEQAAKEQAEKEQAAKEQAAKEQAAKEQAAKEEAAKAEAQRVAAERAKAEEEARKQREREEAEKANTPATGQRSHTVQASETLYRISVNYYGTGDAVDRIKAANGLVSNEISVGQTLILP